jgi:hypothetical protein
MTTIAVTEQTRDTLKNIGKKGETYDEILTRVMELARRQLFYDRQRRILEEEEFVGLDRI